MEYKREKFLDKTKGELAQLSFGWGHHKTLMITQNMSDAAGGCAGQELRSGEVLN